MELPLVTLQSADDDNEQPCEGANTSTNDIVANPMIQEASSLEPQNGRKVPVPTDLPGLQRTDVEGDVDEFGHRKGHRPMFVPEVDEIRIRLVRLVSEVILGQNVSINAKVNLKLFSFTIMEN